MWDCDCVCDTFFDVIADEEQYLLTDFTLKDLRIKARVDNFSEDKLRSVVYENVQVEESTEPAGSWHEVKGFQFGEITFKKPGEYTFNVNETKWNGEAVPAADGNGMQFDRSTKTVKVTVTDDHTGSLKAEVTYPNGAVAFANKYATSSTYNGIQVEKTLQGRNMAAGEFGFTIEGSDDASAALLVDADKQFTNESNRADGVADVMTKLSGHTFTQADSGKHYEFTIKETIPNGAVQDQATGLWYVEATGLYYDGANHVVTIDVADDGNGQLKVTTKVDGHDGSICLLYTSPSPRDTR